MLWDKIRILWIDDREELDGYPQERLPDDFLDHFEIVTPRTYETPSIRSGEDFSPILKEFWFNGDRDILPAEIIASDYNLRKLSGLGINKVASFDDLMGIKPETETRHRENARPRDLSEREVNFEGLLVSVFYGSLTYRHPCAIVPMTRYRDAMPDEVGTLQALTQPFLGVDFRDIQVKQPTWQEIIPLGVKLLRERIEQLFKLHEITVSPKDLLAMSQGNSCSSLKIQSPFAKRSLPIDGLFCDIPENKRPEAKSEWAEALLANVVDGATLQSAEELADCLWGKYLDSELINRRKRLSKLALLKEHKQEPDPEEWESLCRTFGYTGRPNKCTDNVNEITQDKDAYSGECRRWAVLILVARQLVNMIKVKKALCRHQVNYYGEVLMDSGIPILKPDDIFLTLYPLPSSPVILPWHGKENRRVDRSDNWYIRIKNLEEKVLKDGKEETYPVGLCIFNLLEGKGVVKNKTWGIHEGERNLLRGMALEDPDISEKDIREYSPARRVFYGESYDK